MIESSLYSFELALMARDSAERDIKMYEGFIERLKNPGLSPEYVTQKTVEYKGEIEVQRAASLDAQKKILEVLRIREI